jgi:dTDP-4-dehydrorhamnose 3,5-epimerase
MSEQAEVVYKLSAPYDPEHEHTLRWDDPEIGVKWPVSDPLLSARDRRAESLAELRRRGLI